MSLFAREMFAVTLSCLLVFLPVLPASAQATPQRAGDVEAYIPVGKIARTMGEAPSPAVGVDIFWEDRVETEPTGRIRIQLDDGSTLNVGSESQLTVLKHDRVSRQTNLSLAMGKMRCVVKDLKSAKDGKFEVKTNTAVLGVIGTDFFVEATATETRVIVYEGAVRVVNINSSILGTQVIREGQRAVVRTERPPLAPNRATRAELEESVQETRVGEELPQPSSERAEEPSREKKRGLNRWVVVAIAAAVAAAAIAIPVAVSGGKTAPPLPNAPPPGPPPPPPPVD